MSIFSWKRTVALGLLAMLVVAALGCGEAAGGDPFRIGVMESVTGPGETYGTVAVQSKEMAVAEINAAGGINGACWSSWLKTRSATPRTPSPPTPSSPTWTG